MRMAGKLLTNLLIAMKMRRDGVTVEASQEGRGYRMSLSARLILLLTIAVGLVMISGGFFILQQREELHARALRNELYAHAVTLRLTLEDSYLASLWRLTRSARREGLDPDRVASLGLWLIVGAFIGAKLLPVIRQWSEYAADPARLWSRSFLESAGDFYGGFLGALAVAAI